MVPTVALRLALQLGCVWCLLGCANHDPSAKSKDSKNEAKKGADSGGGHDSLGFNYSGDDAVAKRSYKDFKAQKKSAFENKVFNAAKAFPESKQTFKTRDLASNKMFHSGKDEFKTASFSEANKKSWDDKIFKDTKTKSDIGNKTFATKDSPMASHISRDSEKSFHASKETFQTKNDSRLTKAFEHSKPPQMLNGKDKSTYSEDQIRRLLNKD